MSVTNSGQFVEPDSAGVSTKFFYIFGDTVKHDDDITFDTK